MTFSKFPIVKTISTLTMLLTASLFAFPFLWMFLATFKTNLEIFTPFPLLPDEFQLVYFRELLSGKWLPYIKQFSNSLMIAGFPVSSCLISSRTGMS